MKSSVRQLKLGRNWVMQQDNDPKDQALQQLHNRMAEKEMNQSVAPSQSKSRPQPDWHFAAGH